MGAPLTVTLCIVGETLVIPSNSHDGVLPPFIPGREPHELGAVAPYRADLLEVAQRYATSKARIEILQGLVAYREALRSIRIQSGFQWIDGSFVEDCEAIRMRPPSDVDIVTFAFRPQHLSDFGAWSAFIATRPDLFDPNTTKKIYRCDAYFVDLAVNPVHIVNQTRYWFGLFSHQRDTYLWKGMVEVPITLADADASEFLSAEVFRAT